MTPGDAVVYRQVSPGGYGFPSNIPAVFVRYTPKRVVIRVRLRWGGTKEIAVHPANVTVAPEVSIRQERVPR